MVAAAVAGDFDRAMREGWQAFVLSSGDRDREAEVLTNMAQVLHESGRHDAALRGFAAAVTRTGVPTVLLPALGGAASAAANLGRQHIVQAAASRVEKLAGSAWAYPLCSAFLDLADAFSRLRDVQAATAYRLRARAIAAENRFHELTQRADSQGAHGIAGAPAQHRSARWQVASSRTSSALTPRRISAALAASALRGSKSCLPSRCTPTDWRYWSVLEPPNE